MLVYFKSRRDGGIVVTRAGYPLGGLGSHLGGRADKAPLPLFICIASGIIFKRGKVIHCTKVCWMFCLNTYAYNRMFIQPVKFGIPGPIFEIKAKNKSVQM